MSKSHTGGGAVVEISHGENLQVAPGCHWEEDSMTHTPPPCRLKTGKMADKTRDVSSRNGVARLRKAQTKKGPSRHPQLHTPGVRHRPRKCPHPPLQGTPGFHPARARGRPQAAPLSPSTRQASPRPGHDTSGRALPRAQSSAPGRVAPRPTARKLTRKGSSSESRSSSARLGRESHFIARAACQSRPPSPHAPPPARPRLRPEAAYD